MRHHRTAAWVACGLAGALAGCGGSAGVRVGNDAYSKVPAALTIYTDLPLAGPPSASQSVAQQQSIENGARLALEHWHHRVTYGPSGRKRSFHIYLKALDDADPMSGSWSQDLTAANAAEAASQRTTVAYIGDFDSGATALSLPVLSPSGILQVSPWSPYVGFTDANPADGTGDPDRFYPSSAQRNFARVIPSDLTEAMATVSYMQYLGVTRLYVLGDVSVFDAAIAQLVANDAPDEGITVVGLTPGIDTQTNTQPRGYAQIAASVAATRPDAVFLGATPGVGAMALWRELHTMLPRARLFAPSTLATPAFLSGVAAAQGGCKTLAGAPVECASAASATYVTSPILELGQYPAAARAVLRAYRRRFGIKATAYTLYGYSAMVDVLSAIQKAGRQTPDHAVLLKIFFHHMGVIHGVIGSYTINGNGDSSLNTFDGYRLSPAGSLELVHEIRTPVGG